MTTTADQLLRELLEVPHEERGTVFRAHAGEAVDETLVGLAELVDQLAVSEVATAQAGAKIICELAAAYGTPAARVRAQRAQGQALAYGGEFEAALACFESAIALADANDLAMEGALARMSAIHPLSILGRHDEVSQNGAAARNVFVDAGETTLAARIDANLGTTALDGGHPETALQYFDRARAALADNPVATAQIESNRGRALQQLDRHNAARAAYDRALPVFVDAEMYWAAAIVEGNLAELCVREGSVQDALRHLERTRRHLERDDAPNELAWVKRDHAEVLLLIGMLDDAIDMFREAVAALRASNQVVEIPRALAGLGESLLRANQADEAEATLAQANELLDVNEMPILSARVLLLQAEAALIREDLAAAEAYATKALQCNTERPLAAALTRILLARIAQERGNFEYAESELNTAFPVIEEFDVAPLRAELLQLRGGLRRASGAARLALEDLRAAVDLVERVRGTLQADRFRAAFHGNRLNAYNALAATALELDDVGLAFETTERAKSRALLDLTRRVADPIELALHSGDNYEQSLASSLREKRALLDAQYSRLVADRFQDQDQRGQSARANGQTRSLEREVAELEGRLAHTATMRGLLGDARSAVEIREALGADEALVAYTIIDEALAAFVVTRDEIKCVRNVTHEAALLDAVKRVSFQMRRGLRAGGGGPRTERLVNDARRELGTLYDLAFAPIRPLLKGYTKLRVVPHGPLHSAPLHAMWDGTQHLVEIFDFSYAPSASLAIQNGTQQQNGSVVANLVVGVADEYAPRIEHEAQSIAPAIHNSELLLANDATVSAVQDRMHAADIIHIACHGRYAADTPMASGIRLADRWLTVREIHELKLNARLVTLSGCETGRAEVADGEELIGLVRPFLAAGARQLLVSLWTVGDASTESLMKIFYQRLAALDYNTPNALRTAQCELMQEYQHPAHWAPFIVVGGS